MVAQLYRAFLALAVVTLASAGSFRATATAPVTVNANVLVILERPTDNSSLPYTQAQVQTIMNQVSAFYSQASGGNITMTATVTHWLNVPYTNAQLCTEGPATAAAQSAGYNVANYNHFVVLFPETQCIGSTGLAWGGETTGSTSTLLNGSLSPLTHELTAQFFWGQIGDSANEQYCYNTSTYMYADYYFTEPSGVSCEDNFIGDDFTPAGSGEGMISSSVYYFTDFNAPEQAFLGWLTPEVVTQSGTYTISPIEGTTGTRALQVGQYWLEYRQPIGVDSQLSGNPVEGVMFHTSSGALSDLLAVNPAATSLGYPGQGITYENTPALTPGNSYADGNYSFTVLSANSSGATVQIEITKANLPNNLYVADYANRRVDQWGLSGGTYADQTNYAGSYNNGAITTNWNGMLGAPAGIAIDSAGNYWVADANNYRLQEFSPAGAFLMSVPIPFPTSSKVNAIAVDLSNNVWAMDLKGDIVHFNSSGNMLGRFPSSGALKNPQYLTLDSAGDLWISDTGNNRVVEVNSGTGAITRTIGSAGASSGQFTGPRGLAFDTKGNLWVADYGNDRVEEFNSSGTFVTSIGMKGSGQTMFNGPTGLTFNASGNLWVVDTGNHRLEEFSASGTYVGQFGVYGEGAGQWVNPVGIAIRGGVLAVTDNGINQVDGFNAATMAFNFSFGQGTFNPFDVTLAGNLRNTLVATDAVNNRLLAISTYNGSGSTIGSAGSGKGQFNGPRGVAVDNQDNIWVADSGNNRIQEFTSGGTWLRSFGSKGSANGQLNTPRFIAIDAAGDLWVSDFANNRVQKFDTNGNYLMAIGAGYNGVADTIGSHGSGDGQFYGPNGIAFDASGNVWVSDQGNKRVQEFSSGGAFIKTTGSSGTGNGQFANPTGLRFDSNGNLFVVDYGNDRIEEFDSNGNYVTQIGTRGTASGDLDQPWGITIY